MEIIGSWLEVWGELWGWGIFLWFVAAVIFIAVGIRSLYDKYKSRPWEEKYGSKLNQETSRNVWEHAERLEDKILLLEEMIKRNKMEDIINTADKVIADVDYDARYDDC